MGFRNPFRIQVDENDVAYVTDYSPDSQTPQRSSAGPPGVGRFEIVRKPANYGWPLCYSSDLGYYQWNFREFAPGTTTVGTPLDNPPQPIDCGGADRCVNDSRWNLDGGPGVEPGLRDCRRSPIRTSGTRTATTTRRPRSARRASATTRRRRARSRPGSTTECPRLFPELYTGGVGPHGIGEVPLRPGQPEHDEVPAVLRRLGDPRRVHAGHAARDQARRAEPRLQDQLVPATAVQANVANPAFTFECDNPMDMQWGADGDFYLLTYGDGFFTINPDAGMYRWEYVKGTARAEGRARRPTRPTAPLPLTVNSPAPARATRIRATRSASSGTSATASPHSTDPNPTHTYTDARPLHGRPDGHRLVRASRRSTSTVITAGNTARRSVVNTPVDGGTFAFGDDIPFTVDGHRPGGRHDQLLRRPGDVRARPRHARPRRGRHDRLHRRAADGRRPTSSHGGNVFGVISATYTDHGVGHDNVQTLSTTGQTQIRQKHQEVEFVVNQSGTNTATNTDGGPAPPAIRACTAAASPRATGSSSTGRSTC